jgi:uncharacterized repeat protein (TIGR01451 family)
MKRFFLGALALVAVVGVGVGGALVAERYLRAASTADSEEAQPLAAAPRDLTPTPIPVASRQEPISESDDPFVGRTARAASKTDWNVNHDVESPVTRPATEPLDVQPAGSGPEQRAAQADGDIPDAEPLGGASDDRSEARARSSHYAERQAAAEVTEAEPADASADVAATVQDVPAQGVERYGRTAPQGTASRYQRPVAEDSSGAAIDPREQPVAASEPERDRGEEPAALDDEGTGRPGDARLSGSQAPALTIEKTAPPEIQIGKPAKFVIKVRNAGSAVAQGVEIHDSVPQGTQFVEATPSADRGPQGALVWNLGAMKPGEEQKVELVLMPTAEGEIGSVATVHFRAEASVRTLSTKPMLTMEVSGPDKVMKGQQVTLRIKLSNPGTGAATGVVLSEAVPEGLQHPAGKELELDIGTLKPGESRELELGLLAASAGPLTNVVTARGEGSLAAEVQTPIEVIAPQLQVALAGPKRRYLERNATHSISVSNPGTAAAKEIELVAVLPKELKFVEANNGGQFDAATRSVYWSLEELPPQETGTVTLTTLPLSAGEAKLLIKSTAQQNLADQREEVVAIEGLAAINFQLSDVNDPIEAGGQTTYEIRVTNQGSKAATGVRLLALVPKELKPISAEGPVRYTIESGRVVFEPLKQLAPKADTTYSVKVQALSPGDLRLQVQVTTDDIRDPITREESTRVFGDE